MHYRQINCAAVRWELMDLLSFTKSTIKLIQNFAWYRISSVLVVPSVVPLLVCEIQCIYQTLLLVSLKSHMFSRIYPNTLPDKLFVLYFVFIALSSCEDNKSPHCDGVLDDTSQTLTFSMSSSPRFMADPQHVYPGQILQSSIGRNVR